MSERVVLATGVEQLDIETEKVIQRSNHTIVGKAYYREGVKIVSSDNKATVVVLSPQLPGSTDLLSVIKELRLDGTRVVLLPGSREDDEAVNLVRRAVALGVYDIVWDLVSPIEIAEKIDNAGTLKDVGVEPDFSAVAFVDVKVSVDAASAATSLAESEQAKPKKRFFSHLFVRKGNDGQATDAEGKGFFSRLFGRKENKQERKRKPKVTMKEEAPINDGTQVVVESSKSSDVILNEASQEDAQKRQKSIEENSSTGQSIPESRGDEQVDILNEGELFKPLARKVKRKKQEIDPLALLGLSGDVEDVEDNTQQTTDAFTVNEEQSALEHVGTSSVSEADELPRISMPEEALEKAETSSEESAIPDIDKTATIADSEKHEEHKIIQVNDVPHRSGAEKTLPNHGVVFVISPGNASLSSKVAAMIALQTVPSALICGANASTAALELGMSLEEIAASDWRIPGSIAPVSYKGVDVWPIDPQKFVVGGRRDMLWAVIAQARRKYSLVVVDAAADIDVLAGKSRADIVLAVKAGNEGDWIVEKWAEENKNQNVVLYMWPEQSVSVTGDRHGFLVQIG